MATWGEVKAQAADARHPPDRPGRRHRAAAAHRPVRQFIPDADGLRPGHHRHRRRRHSRTRRTTSSISGTSAAPVGRRRRAIRIDHAFLADIAHDAVPIGNRRRRHRNRPGQSRQRPTTEYDNELLDAHFIAGDGRANENIGLTAVHHVFHAEHNRLVEHTKDDRARRPSDLAFLNEWLVDRRRRALPTTPAEIAALRLGWRAPVPGRQVRHRDAVPASRVRGIRPQDPAQHRLLRGAGRLRHRRSIRRSSPSSRTWSTASATRC